MESEGEREKKTCTHFHRLLPLFSLAPLILLLAFLLSQEILDQKFASSTVNVQDIRCTRYKVPRESICHLSPPQMPILCRPKLLFILRRHNNLNVWMSSLFYFNTNDTLALTQHTLYFFCFCFCVCFVFFFTTICLSLTTL